MCRRSIKERQMLEFTTTEIKRKIPWLCACCRIAHTHTRACLNDFLSASGHSSSFFSLVKEVDIVEKEENEAQRRWQKKK